MSDNNSKSPELTEFVVCFEKIETIIRVLAQTLCEDSDFFDLKDSQNLCSVLLRETNYSKSKFIYNNNNSTEKITL